MVKNDIFKNVAKRADVSPEIVETVLTAYTEFIVDTLRDNKSEKIVLPDMGTFSVKNVKEKTGIIQIGPKKGDAYVIPAHPEIYFKMSKTAKNI